MTARADISNARRKKLEERSKTAWEKGEAKPPFYREVLEEGVRRGDVWDMGMIHAEIDEQRGRAVDEAIEQGDVVPRHRYEFDLGYANDKQLELEDKLREAEGRIERARKVLDDPPANIGAAAIQRSRARSILAGTEKEGAA